MGCDETAAELELLAAMFSEEELDVDGEGRWIACLLKPRTGGEAVTRHIEAWLRLALPADYPASPPVPSLLRVRGLVGSEEERLLCAVRKGADERCGQPCLHELIECGAEALTELNCSGECPICYDPLFTPDGHVFLSPCFHSFHAACIGIWWKCYDAPARNPPGGAGLEAAECQGSVHAVEAAAMAAKAAAAEARVLTDKLTACQAAVGAARGRLDLLRAQQDPPAPAAALRAVTETLKQHEQEEAQLYSRVEKVTARATALAVRAEETAAEQAALRDAMPLPCPVCRVPIAICALRQAQVVSLPPPPPGDGIITAPRVPIEYAKCRPRADLLDADPSSEAASSDQVALQPAVSRHPQAAEGSSPATQRAMALRSGGDGRHRNRGSRGGRGGVRNSKTAVAADCEGAAHADTPEKLIHGAVPNDQMSAAVLLETKHGATTNTHGRKVSKPSCNSQSSRSNATSSRGGNIKRGHKGVNIQGEEPGALRAQGENSRVGKGGGGSCALQEHIEKRFHDRWACSACTYLHESPHELVSCQCIICGSPRAGLLPSCEVWPQHDLRINDHRRGRGRGKGRGRGVKGPSCQQ
eukprot:scaffold284257_cov30-Tisochrysis_lutea.AAC.1